MLTFFPSSKNLKDAMDLVQGHYILSVSRSTTPTSQERGIEAIAVSKIFLWISYLELTLPVSSLEMRNLYKLGNSELRNIYAY